MDTSIYSHALDLWSEANFLALQQQLDDSVLDSKERDASALDSRKDLAAKTKKFKKLDESEKLSSVNKLIKQYQQEIDSLTERAKASEKVLLNLYAKLAEAPDPQPLLQNVVDQLSKLDDTEGLKSKVADLEEQLAKYADYNSLKSRLLDLEQNAAETLSKRLVAKEQELESKWEEKERNWKEREAELSKQIETLKESGGGGGDSINLTEVALLAQELESAQSRVFQLEKRNEDLSGSLAKATSKAEQESELHSRNMKINHLESENALLSATVEKTRKELTAKETSLKSDLELAKNGVKSYKSEVEALQRKLEHYADYDRIKEELFTLKKIEFGAGDNDDDGNANENGTNRVDNTLVLTNKKLQSNLAELRSKYAQEKETNEGLQKDIKILEAKITELQTLNTRLEMDLEKVEDMDQKFNDTASMVSGATRQLNNRVGKNSGRLSPTSSIVGIPEEEEMGPMGNSGSNSSATILPIISKQRDRFRNKSMELEKELRQQAAEKNKLKVEIKNLKSDLSKLQDQLRYFSNRRQNTEGNDFDQEAQYPVSTAGSTKNKASEYYRMRGLTVWERLFSRFSKIVSATRRTKVLFVLYEIGLHFVLVVLMVYILSVNNNTSKDGIRTNMVADRLSTSAAQEAVAAQAAAQAAAAIAAGAGAVPPTHGDAVAGLKVAPGPV